jgi:protein-S-isoprenylcysteine O-methyltransferase Ste14
MTEKLWVGLLFLAFVFVRLRWPRGTDERKSIRPLREWGTSTIFTLSFLISYGLYFWSDSLQGLLMPIPFIIQVLGGVFAFFGVALLEWVHRALGIHFSPHLELRSDHQIVQDGPYRYVRHPMYTSGCMYLVGSGLLSGNWVVLLCPTLSFLLLLVLRLPDEERMLADFFGADWFSYRKKTGALLPQINDLFR